MAPLLLRVAIQASLSALRLAPGALQKLAALALVIPQVVLLGGAHFDGKGDGAEHLR